LPRPCREIHAHRQHHRTAGAGQGQARTELVDHCHLRRDDLRAHRQTRAGQSRMTRQRTRMPLHTAPGELSTTLLILSLWAVPSPVGAQVAAPAAVAPAAATPAERAPAAAPYTYE